MIPFTDLEQKLSKAVDQQFAEAFLFCPRTRPANLSSRADPSRDAQQLLLVFDERHKQQKSGQAQQSISVLNPWCDLELSLLNCEVKKHDVFIRVADHRAYEVKERKPDGQGRAKLQFSLVGHCLSCADLL